MVKPLSLNEIRQRCAKFAKEWADEPGEERQQILFEQYAALTSESRGTMQ